MQTSVFWSTLSLRCPGIDKCASLLTRSCNIWIVHLFLSFTRHSSPYFVVTCPYIWYVTVIHEIFNIYIYIYIQSYLFTAYFLMIYLLYHLPLYILSTLALSICAWCYFFHMYRTHFMYSILYHVHVCIDLYEDDIWCLQQNLSCARCDIVRQFLVLSAFCKILCFNLSTQLLCYAVTATNHVWIGRLGSAIRQLLRVSSRPRIWDIHRLMLSRFDYSLLLCIPQSLTSPLGYCHLFLNCDFKYILLYSSYHWFLCMYNHMFYPCQQLYRIYQFLLIFSLNISIFSIFRGD